MPQENILLISDPKVLAVPIEDNGDKLVNLRDLKELLIDDRKSKSSRSFSYLRDSVASKLINAQRALPEGIRFLIVEGHRPLSLQKEYFDGYSTELKKLHPEWLAGKIYQEASKYVAPPAINPPHSTGGAVDLTLVDETGKELDMGTRVNADPEESQNACFTSASNISEKAKQNRNILIAALSGNEFINYPTEWWHWSYGDRYWACHAKKPFAIFGSIEP
jgi:zinc D-Ala-D-Ala dipeptidase